MCGHPWSSDMDLPSMSLCKSSDSIQFLSSPRRSSSRSSETPWFTTGISYDGFIISGGSEYKVRSEAFIAKCKAGCVFLMVIRPEFRLGLIIDGAHR